MIDHLTPLDAVLGIGPACFGLMIGWITYRTLRRKEGAVQLADLAGVLGAIGGGVVTGLFAGNQFSFYCIGLALGFFGYLTVSWMAHTHEAQGKAPDPATSPTTWMGAHDPPPENPGWGQRPGNP
ncbi:MAG: hypothetical protein QOG31_804 [Thermoplasmata archaeon]|jgi:uncharacterized membrane protein YeaQ/YmgE (transglycosylase-associated protein family)|nr:hypothetical protein [Thermoplasmata archaeon]